MDFVSELGRSRGHALIPLLFFAMSSFAAPTGNSFQFIIENAPESGCVHLTYATAAQNFPHGISTIRFFYSSGDPTTVTEASASFVSTVKYDTHGNMSLVPIKFCGLAHAHYNFKYGLADPSGVLREFMTPSEFNPDTNGVEVP
jgi:hypothetical protein